MTSKEEVTPTNMAFSCFAYSLLGWLVLEIAIAKIASGIGPFISSTLLGFALCAISLRRRRSLWDGGYVRNPALLGKAPARSPADFASAALLLLAGAVLGALATMSFTLFGIVAAIAGIAPWSKIPLCRKHFLPCGLLLAVSTLVTMLGNHISAINLLISAWMLWLIAVGFLCATLGKSRDFSEGRNQNGGWDARMTPPSPINTEMHNPGA